MTTTTKKAEPRANAIQPVEGPRKESSPRRLPKPRPPVKLYLVLWREAMFANARPFLKAGSARAHLAWARDAHDPGAMMIAYERVRR